MYRFWKLNRDRQKEGIIELRSTDGHFNYYVKKDNIEIIKEEVKFVFCLHPEELEEVLQILENIF